MRKNFENDLAGSIKYFGIDLLKAMLIEMVWVVLGVGLTGYLTEHWLKSLWSGWAFLGPIILFALLSLVLTVCLKPRWYAIAIVCTVAFINFKSLQDVFEYGFSVWEMFDGGGWMDWGRIAQLFFWIWTFVLEAIALGIGNTIRKLLKKRNSN